MIPRADTSPKSVGRPADRQNQVLKEIREKIVKGEFARGSRLPTREELARSYGFSTNTVQHALDKLKSEGFVEANERGTRVSMRPPHLTRYAIVFPGLPDDGTSWTRFWTVLDHVAKEFEGVAGNDLLLYYDVSSDPTMPDYQSLLSDVLSHALAGVIFVTFPHRLVGTPILDEPGIPRVGIMSRTVKPTIPAITPDMGSFYEGALAALRARGCRRVAFLNAPGEHAVTEELMQRVHAAGMISHEHWNVSGHILFPKTSHGLMRLLFQGARETWPDGLIIGDDNFVEHATEGIRAAGVRVPEDVQIVAHTNYPCSPASVLPVTWLGFDAREILQLALQQVDAIRQGNTVANQIQIAARFENQLLEVTANAPSVV